MTQKETKIFLGLLIVAGIATILVAGKQAECEAGFEECKSTLVEDLIRICREPLISADAIASVVVPPIKAIEDAIDMARSVR